MKAQLKYVLLQNQCSLIHPSLHISIPPSLLPFFLSSYLSSFLLSWQNEHWSLLVLLKRPPKETQELRRSPHFHSDSRKGKRYTWSQWQMSGWCIHPEWCFWLMGQSTVRLFHPEWPPTYLLLHAQGVSPEPFCTPEVFGLVANIFHKSEILLASMTTHLLASATGSRRKTEVNVHWILEGENPALAFQQNSLYFTPQNSVFKAPVGNKWEMSIQMF